MCDFVAQHRSELCFIFHNGQQPPGNGDRSTGQGKRIWCGIVDDRELIGQVRPVAVTRQAFADGVHIFIQLRIGIAAAHLLDHLGIRSLSQFDFLAFGDRDQRQLSFPCHGINGTSCQHYPQ
jgi:hypothetical protein